MNPKSGSPLSQEGEQARHFQADNIREKQSAICDVTNVFPLNSMGPDAF